MITWGDMERTEAAQDKAAKEARETARGITRLLIGGHAGGAAVALALIHSSLGKCGPYPGTLFLVLTVFVVGLAALWFAMARDHRTIQFAGLMATADKDSAPGLTAAIDRYEREIVIARKFAGFSLIAGMSAGLVLLASFASWRL